ncbi:universal stress protein [Streptomyces sp. NPDC001691]|uniref:universal stress protein n=1 Tax=unclassified Streptomyces TaxID=2593676 RepID=UPI000DE8957C|nr:universal stress protein [Streptomyces sp. SDr-06]RCH70352.1 universal stress protein [Streptomyces sp. SDr-06]
MDRIGGRRVVAGVSGSLGSLTALHRAAREAAHGGGTLVAVLAWAPPGGELGHRGSLDPDLLAQCRAMAAERLLTALDTAFGPAGPAVPLEATVVRGTPGAVLVEAARAAEDLLVLGTGPRGRLRRALRPSVARYCLAHASCPVLAVPPSPLEHELAAVHRLVTWRRPLDARELAE